MSHVRLLSVAELWSFDCVFMYVFLGFFGFFWVFFFFFFLLFFFFLGGGV